MRFYSCSYLLVTFLLFLLNSINGQGDNSKKIKASQIEHKEQLTLDGKLDDEIWRLASSVDDFLMQVPIEGEQPTERTEVYIAYDENNLYIAVNLEDRSAENIKSFQKRRDNEFDTDDRFQWILDTFKDGRNAYYFAINPAGAMRDGLLTIGQGTSLNINWDGIWRAWTNVHATGWTAEIRIPFRTLNFDPKADIWGINFQRTIRKTNEEIVWSGHQRNLGLLRPQNAGILSDLSGISQGIGLEAKPYAAARRRAINNDDDELVTTYEGDFGLDVNYNLTPGLKASFTYNTDFAEAEVDTRRINLTRFPLFFPEKRSFFLEGSSIYSFAPSSRVIPYFSRRIGLSGGEAVPINAGARLLGRVGNYDMALQHVMTEGNDDINAEHFTVARVKRNIGRESRIGFVYTRRSTNDGNQIEGILDSRHTIGADLELNTSQFLGDKNLQFQAFFVYHNPDSPLNQSKFWDRTTRGLRINFPNRPWYGHTSYREFGTAFNPALGFHPRVGFRRLQPSLGYNPLFEKSQVIRDIDFGFWFEHLMDMDWNLLTQDMRFDIETTFESAERIEFSIGRNFERLTGDFDILGDGSIVIPTDDYTNWGLSTEFATASYRSVSLRVDFETGGFWSGTQTEIGSALTVRPIPGINLTGTYVHTNVSLDEGEFSTDLFRFNASFDMTPFISFSSFIQWDNLSDQIGINNRFRWIITPGNDLFIVYNHNWEDRFDRWKTLNSIVTMKATYTHRF